MYKKIVILLLSASMLLSACRFEDKARNVISGNGNGCNVSACTNPPTPCTIDVHTFECK